MSRVGVLASLQIQLILSFDVGKDPEIANVGENEEQGGWVAHSAVYPDLSAWGDTRKAPSR